MGVGWFNESGLREKFSLALFRREIVFISLQGFFYKRYLARFPLLKIVSNISFRYIPLVRLNITN